MKTLFIFLGLVFPYFLLADSTSYLSRSGQDFIEVYRENDQWVMEHFHIAPGELQVRAFRKSFQYLNDLEHFKAAYTQQNFMQESAVFSSLIFTQTELPGDVIWKADKQWDLDWEEAYSKWLEKNFDKNFFNKYKIKTDCADVAFSLRWIFARINGLPAANTLAGSGVLFSNESMKRAWKNLPTDTIWYKDQRFLTALDYLLDNAYTKTLYKDTYPIKIEKDIFKVGTINLLGGHTEVVSRIFRGSPGTLPIKLLYSTSPAIVRTLGKNYFVMKNNTPQDRGGILRYRWPVKNNGIWELIPKEMMPHYSLEQYSEEFQKGGFANNLMKKIGVSVDAESILTSSLDFFKTKLNDRVLVVQDGYQFCRANNCDKGSVNYDDWSTPSRDKRLIEEISSVQDIVYAFGILFPDIVTDFEKALKETTIEIENKKLSLEFLINRLNMSLVSHDPRDPISERWAVTDKDALNVLGRKFITLKTARKEIVDSASVCRQSPNLCKKGSSNWLKFQTYERDAELKRFLAVFHQLCLGKGLNCDLQEEYHKIPFYLSNPLFSFKERVADSIERDEVSFFPSSFSVIELEKEGYYLAGNKIYHLPSNSYVPFQAEIKKMIYLKSFRSLVALTKKNKVVEQNWDGSFQELLSLPSEIKEVSLLKTSNEKVVVKYINKNSSKEVAQTYLYQKGKLKLEYDFEFSTAVNRVINYTSTVDTFLGAVNERRAEVINLITGDRKEFDIDNIVLGTTNLEGFVIIGKYLYEISTNTMKKTPLNGTHFYTDIFKGKSHTYAFVSVESSGGPSDMRCHYLKFDNHLNLLLKKEIAQGHCLIKKVKNDKLIISASASSTEKASVYFFDGGRLKPLVLPKDEASFGGSDQDFYLINYKEKGESKLFTTDTHKEVQTFQEVNLAIDESPYKPGFITYSSYFGNNDNTVLFYDGGYLEKSSFKKKTVTSFYFNLSQIPDGDLGVSLGNQMLVDPSVDFKSNSGFYFNSNGHGILYNPKNLFTD